MENEERLIKQSLQENKKIKKSTDCPNEQILMGYLKGSLSLKDREALEKHLSECSLCLEQVGTAFETHKKYRDKEFKPVPKAILEKTESSLGISKNKYKTAQENKIRKWLFLSVTITFFILSFVIPKYFLQFLTGALILGIRWSFESKNAKTLIMVLDSWRRHSHDKDSDISNRLKDRL